MPSGFQAFGSAEGFVGTMPGFTPASLSSAPFIWLRGDHATVSSWTDLSTHAYNFAQATVANQPTINASDAAYGNQKTVSFAANQFMRSVAIGILAQPWTLWFVGECGSTAADRMMYADGAATGTQFEHFTDDRVYLNGSANAAAAALRSPSAAAWIVNGASSKQYLNDFTTATSMASTAGTRALGDGSHDVDVGSGGGTTNPWVGKFAEWIAMPGIATAQDLSNMRTYLHARYGLTIA